MPRVAERIRLTETVVKNLEPPGPGETARLYRDSILVGFACRVAYGGTKAFVVHYTTKSGRERRYTLGTFPAWSALAARERAKEIRRQVDLGGDPAQADHERRHTLTFGELVKQYQKLHVTKSGRRMGDHHKNILTLNREAIPKWRDWPAEDVKRSDIRALIDEKAQTLPAAANKILATLSSLYNFGVDRELVKENPARRIKKPGVLKPRDRALNERELKAVWNALEAYGSIAADVLRMILLTGQRPGECATVEWSEVELEEAIWALPASKAKNGLAHKIPLSQTAIEIIKAQPRKNAYVFPGRQRASIYPGEPATLLRERKYFGLDEFRPHDLRRSCATGMATIGMPRFIISRILNHSQKKDMTAVYERYEHLKEQREALDRWERHLLKIAGKPRAADVVEIAR